MQHIVLDLGAVFIVQKIFMLLVYLLLIFKYVTLLLKAMFLALLNLSRL